MEAARLVGTCAFDWTGGLSASGIRTFGVADWMDGDAQPDASKTIPDRVRIKGVNESRIAAVRWFANGGRLLLVRRLVRRIGGSWFDNWCPSG
jgi:hypothetical protein